MGGVSRGPKNGNWKGGRTVSSHGYVLIRVDKNHPLVNRNGYAYEHRLIAQQKLGRKLTKRQRIHHDDHDKLNNAAENLVVTNSAFEHLMLHRKAGSKYARKPGEANRIVKCRCGCGTTFRRFNRWGRIRFYVSGHNSWAR